MTATDKVDFQGKVQPTASVLCVLCPESRSAVTASQTAAAAAVVGGWEPERI